MRAMSSPPSSPPRLGGTAALFAAAVLTAAVGIWMVAWSPDNEVLAEPAGPPPATPAAPAPTPTAPPVRPAADPGAAEPTPSPPDRGRSSSPGRTESPAIGAPPSAPEFDPAAPYGWHTAPPETLDELDPELVDADPADLPAILATRPVNIPADVEAAAVTEAWSWLVDDLTQGRWTDLTLEAAAAAAPGGLDYVEHPALVLADLWYSGRDPTGRSVSLLTATVALGLTPDSTWLVHGLRAGDQ